MINQPIWGSNALGCSHSFGQISALQSRKLLEMVSPKRRDDGITDDAKWHSLEDGPGVGHSG